MARLSDGPPELRQMVNGLIRLMRPTDWTKNVFVLPAVVFSMPRRLEDASEPAQEALLMLASGAIAFIAFSLVASGFYAINDVLDVEKDRSHPVKRTRPVASGDVPGRVAMMLGVALIIGGLGLGMLVTFGLGLTLILYALLQISYNLRLKYVLFVDVTAVSLGFVLRAVAGATAINVQVSIWLLMCVFFLCLYLAFVKRLCDIASARASGDGGWHSPAGYGERDELNWLLGISAVLAVVTYLMYALSDQTQYLFGVRSLGFALLTPLVLISMHRFYRRAMHGISDSPFSALVQDRAVIASVLLFGAGILITLFVPGVDSFFQSIFFLTPTEVGR